MKTLACFVLLVGLAASSTGQTSLRIAYRARPGSELVVRTLACRPARGSLLHAADACRRLAGLDAPFAPVPKGQACTMIYGGPQRALVTGTFRGRAVWARFTRVDGCQIARWKRAAFLFPPL